MRGTQREAYVEQQRADSTTTSRQSSAETQRWPQRDAVLGVPGEQHEDGSTLSGTVPLGSLYGVRIFAHYSLPFSALILPVMFVFTPSCTTDSLGVCYAFGVLIYGPVLFGTVLIHELSHALAANLSANGTGCYVIVLWILGGASLTHDRGRSDASNAFIAILGPLSHLLQFSAWMALLQLPRLAGHWPEVKNGWISSSPYFAPSDNLQRFMWHDICVYALYFNVGLFAFNLLVPIVPLDGAQLLASLLIMCGVSANTTALTLTTISSIMLLALLLGVLFFSWTLILVGLFLVRGVFELERMRRSGLLEYHPLFEPAFRRSSSGSSRESGYQLRGLDV